jgi:hypothetical protein
MMNTDNSMNQPKDTLKGFLKEEIENIKKRLDFLKGNLKAEDYNALDAELKEKSLTLDSLNDEDQTPLFILRREIGSLRENMEALAVKQSWWSRLPVYARILVITVPVVLYLIGLSLIQLLNKGQIYDYPTTQTAIASQTMVATQATASLQVTLSGPAVTPTPATTQAP